MSLPRARGGVPDLIKIGYTKDVSSPRTRGCSRCIYDHRRVPGVFPAHAGVFPMTGVSERVHRSLPRARGGVPSPPTHR